MFGSTNPFGQSLMSPFCSQSVLGEIQSMQLFRSKSDAWIWKPDHSGSYSVKSAYSLMMESEEHPDAQFLKNLWKGKAPSKVVAFVWKVFNNGLPTKDNLIHRVFGQTNSSSNPFSPKPFTTPFDSSIVFGAAQFLSSFSSTKAFGASSSPAFGSSVPAFGSSSNPTFGSSSSSFGRSTEANHGNSSGRTATLVSISAMPIYQYKSHKELRWEDNQQCKSASRVARYTPTTEADRGTSGHTEKLVSISAMPIYTDKSLEELRWEDNQQCKIGSRVASYKPATETDRGTSSGQTAKLVSISAMPIYVDRSLEELRWEDNQQWKIGSKAASYTPAIEADRGTSGQTATLCSILTMPIDSNKSLEELRWEDYQLGDKGRPLLAAQTTDLAGFSSSTTQTNTFSPSSVFGQSSTNPFSIATPNSNAFAPKTSMFPSGFGTSAAPAFSSSAFDSSISGTAPAIFGSSSSPFGASSSTPRYQTASPTKLISALKGSREKSKGSTMKLTVKWAPDVYDPVPTLSSHTIRQESRNPARRLKRKVGRSIKKEIHFEGEAAKIRSSFASWGVLLICAVSHLNLVIK